MATICVRIPCASEGGIVTLRSRPQTHCMTYIYIEIDKIAFEFLDVAVVGDMWHNLIFFSLNNTFCMKRLGKVAVQPQRE